MKLRDIMTTQVETCNPTETVVQAAKLMKTVDVGLVPLVEGKRLVGVVTDRDIVINCVAEGKDIQSTLCQEVMTPSIVTGTPDMTADQAAKLMADHQIRRLPVVEKEKLVGIVALGDLATISIHENEAGYALSEISESTNVH